MIVSSADTAQSQTSPSAAQRSTEHSIAAHVEALTPPAPFAAQSQYGHKPVVAVLAVQGAFIEHEHKLKNMGVSCIELRSHDDLKHSFNALVLPGGESTVQGKLLKELNMLEGLRNLIKRGMPVLATCAGMILLATKVTSGEGPYLATLPMSVKRNAYGRQLDSFHTTDQVEGIGRVPMTFIRAPFVEALEPGAQVLARVKNNIVAVRHYNQIALAFHPELDTSCALHQAFLNLIH